MKSMTSHKLLERAICVVLGLFVLSIPAKIYFEYQDNSGWVALRKAVDKDILAINKQLADNPKLSYSHAHKFHLHSGASLTDFYISTAPLPDQPFIVYSGSLTSPYDIVFYRGQGGMITQLKRGRIDTSKLIRLSDLATNAANP